MDNFDIDECTVRGPYLHKECPQKDMKEVHAESFNHDFKSVTYPDDETYYVMYKKELVALCSLHNEPPVPLANGPGKYMYNLCVRKSYRHKGIGELLLNYVKKMYSVIYIHTETKYPKKYQRWFVNLGFVKLNKWRQYTEYVHSWKDVTRREEVEYSKYYDPIENIIYLTI